MNMDAYSDIESQSSSTCKKLNNSCKRTGNKLRILWS